MNTKPSVSIIMPAYNAAKTISDSIQSVLNQTYTDWELIIINDGSSDSTSSIVGAYPDPRIILLEQQNSGVAEARNNGIRHARGNMIAFLDSDDLWIETKLEKFMLFIQQQNFCGLAYSKIRYFSDNPADSLPYNPWEPFHEINPYHNLLLIDYIPTLTVMVNKIIFDEVGLFDKNFFGTEDWDMWLRIVKKHPIALISEELSLYRNHESGISKKFDRQHQQQYNVMQKHLLNDQNIAIVLKKKGLWLWTSYLFVHRLKNFQILDAFGVYIKMISLLPFSSVHARFTIMLFQNYLNRFFKNHC